MLQWLKGSKAVHAAVGILIVAIATGVSVVLEGLGESWSAVWRLAILFAIPGSIIGTAVMLDSRSPAAVGDFPITRSLVSAAALGGVGVIFPLLMKDAPHYSLLWCVGLAVIGGVLGWLGWRWARYVDF